MLIERQYRLFVAFIDLRLKYEFFYVADKTNA